jgi:hypothetical protein
LGAMGFGDLMKLIADASDVKGFFTSGASLWGKLLALLANNRLGWNGWSGSIIMPIIKHLGLVN